MGALLIRGSAYWARHHYIKEIKLNAEADAEGKSE